MADEINETTQTDAVKDEEQTQETEQSTQNQRIPYERFKQKVDEAKELKERLEAIEAEKAEDERKRLEESNEFRTLYEQAQEQIKQINAKVIEGRKDAALAKAGYTDEQITVLRGTVTGETDEEIAQAVEGLKAVITPSPTYVDPGLGNGAKDKAEQVDTTEKGRSLYQRLRGE